LSSIEIASLTTNLKPPKKVIMADYDDKEGDFYTRFDEASSPRGEPTKDGLALVHREKGNSRNGDSGLAELEA
jgi:hypothetical protein